MKGLLKFEDVDRRVFECNRKVFMKCGKGRKDEVIFYTMGFTKKGVQDKRGFVIFESGRLYKWRSRKGRGGMKGCPGSCCWCIRQNSCLLWKG